MPLHASRPPRKLFAMAVKTVEDLGPDLEDLIQERGHPAEGPFSIVAAHPVFTMTPLDMRHRGLKKARRSGWRAMLTRSDEPVATIEFRFGESARDLHFSNVSVGKGVEGFVRAVAAGERSKESRKDEYEIRLLRIPALYVTAVWMRGKQSDWLIPIPPTYGRFEPFRPREPDRILSVLAEEVHAITKGAEPA